MIKKTKTFIGMLLAVVLVLSCACPAFAVEADENEPAPALVYNQQINVDGDWTIAYTNPNGINRSVTIAAYPATALHWCDVRMLNSAGGVVWEETGAINFADARTFSCGANVVQIQVRFSDKEWAGWLVAKKGVCNVYF